MLLSGERGSPLSAGDPVCLFDRSRDVDARAGVELAEHVADVRLDGLLAEEQLVGDLGVGLAIDDQSGDLKLATGEGCDAGLAEVARSGASVDVLAELAQFAFGRVSIADRAAAVELGGRLL